jgi:hypothetical protein
MDSMKFLRRDENNVVAVAVVRDTIGSRRPDWSSGSIEGLVAEDGTLLTNGLCGDRPS